MTRSGTSLLFGLGLFFILMIIFGLMPSQVLAESVRQNSPCGSILVEAANRVGFPMDNPTWYSDDSQPWSCYVAYTWQPDKKSTSTVNFKITPANWEEGENYTCQSKYCEVTSFHGYPAILVESTALEFQWHMKRGDLEYDLFVSKNHYSGVEKSEVLELAEALLAVASSSLPGNSENGLENPIVPGLTEIPPDVSLYPPDNSGNEVPDGGEIQPGGDSFGHKSLGPLATNPLVPLAGALIGTVVGWLISIMTVFGNQPRTTIAPPPLPKMPVPVSPIPPMPVSPVLTGTSPDQFWKDWDNNTPDPPDDPPLKEENYDEMHKYKLDGYQSKDLIMQNYQDDIPEWRREKIDPQKMHFVDTEAFNKHYVEKNHAANDMGVDGLADPETLEMYIDKDKAMNYAPLHEMMHVSSNKEFCNTLNMAIDEAATDYFTNKIADRNKVPRATYYMINDSVKVVEEMIHQIGEPALRKAFFGEGKQGIDELRYMVDKKIKPGAFDKVVDLMSKGKNLKARALLRGKNLAE